jgi:DNA helicase II / ATP-dependent DNA helicase PcrA
MESLFNKLNQNQYRAVSSPLKPVLVLAGPGTGKTRILVARIVWLIEKNKLDPGQILALTFTNKAASEMKSRLEKYLGTNADLLNAGTFHAFSLSLLRKYHTQAGLDKYFAVCDQEYQYHLVQNLAAPYIRENLENKVRGILLSFSNHQVKNRKLPQFAADLFAKYQEHLTRHHLIDFDQIILKCRDLLLNNSDILAEYRHLYPAVLVDEFQDTDPVQYEILNMLTIENKNVFVVADDDQSIYSWRGANPENINRFIKEFKIKTPVFLDINYRSGNKILEAAQRVIVKTKRIEPNKNFKVPKNIENHLNLQFFMDEKSEIEYVLKKIEDWRSQNIDFKEMAIIYPYHKIGQQLEKHLLQAQIPFQLAEGKSLFDHPAIKKVILYLRLIRDSEDPVALESLATHELGPAISGIIKQTAVNQSISFRKSLYSYYRDKSNRLSHDLRLKIQSFVNYLANVINLKDFYSFEQLLDEIYSTLENAQYSSLANYKSQLQPVSEVGQLNQFKSIILDGKRIYVHCLEKEIRMLAEEMIRRVMKSTVVNSFDECEVVIALDPDVRQDKPIIAVYDLISQQRKGKLSCLFKLLQWYSTKDDRDLLESYVILDLETTDKNTETCGIVEIAAIRVHDTKITDRLQTLIDPQMPISRGAQSVHNISEADVKNKPHIDEYWPEFKKFVGDLIIIAHNGHQFDFPILDRFAKKLDNTRLKNIRFDSLVMARGIFPGQSNSIDALMDRFQLSADARHRAMDDVIVLNDIINKMQKIKSEQTKQSSLEIVLDIVALGNIVENKVSATEDQIFFSCGSRRLLSPYSKIRSVYARTFNQDEKNIQEKIRSKINLIEPYRSEEDNWQRIKDLAHQFAGQKIDEAIMQFLSFISLNSGQDQLQDINAISMLTFHAAKGLEFDKVILLGMENNNMPSFLALRDDSDDDRPVAQKLEEQRRLFYVGLTRAKTELLLTAVKNRGGWERESSPFLKDINTITETSR